MATPKVFLSYSHRDKQYVDEFLVHSAPLRRRYAFELWSDQKIEPGDLWQAEIESAAASASIALLFVSPDYLASDWIVEYELPKLVDRAQSGQMRIIPVILRLSAWAHTPLAYFQAFPRDAKPLDTLSLEKRDRIWAELSEVLEAQLHHLAGSQEDPAPPERKPRQGPPLGVTNTAPVTPDERAGLTPDISSSGLGPRFFISHAKEDGDFAENLQGRLKAIGLDGWIDIDVLEAGVDWRQEIDDAILTSRALILILSPDAKNSEYVTYEWAFALGSGLRIVPLMVRDTPIHPRLEVFQYLDFTNRRARPWDRLFALLHGGL